MSAYRRRRRYRARAKQHRFVAFWNCLRRMGKREYERFNAHIRRDLLCETSS